MPLVNVRVTKSAIKAYMVDKLRQRNAEGAYRTICGDRVLKDHFGPLQAEELPAIIVFASEETSEYLDVTEDRRHLKVQLEIQAVGDDADVQLDLISDVIIDTFRNDEYLGGDENGLAEWCRYTGGHLWYDEKRHLNGAVWVDDFDVRYLWESVPDGFVGQITPFTGADVTIAFAEGNPQPPIVIAEAGSQIEIPQI